MTDPGAAATGVAFPHRHVPIARSGGPRQAIVLELAAPLALGQRGLVIGPPRTGATTVLRWLGDALVAAEPELELVVILVDQPVEEHLEWRYELPTARVVGTSSDVTGPEEHTALVEHFHAASEAAAAGAHVAVFVDSLAQLARALVATSASGDERILDGGMPQATLRELRGLFGLARSAPLDEPDAGSLTVLATVHTETHQQLDEVVLHELVGTGNVEWRLDSDAMKMGLFPPVDILASGARRTELIIGEREADRRAALRAEVDQHGVGPGLGLLIDRIDDLGSLDAVLDELDSAE